MWKLYYGKDRENYERIIIAENAEAASKFAHASRWVDKYPVCIGLADEYDVELKCDGVDASILMVTKDIAGDGIFAVEKYSAWIETRGKCPDRRCGTCKYICTTFANEPCVHCRAAAEWLPNHVDEEPKSGRYPWGTGKKQEEEKHEVHNCTTCKYQHDDVFGPVCKPCKCVDGQMTNWTPVDEKTEEKTDKPLSEYTVEELKAELDRRREEQIEEARKKAFEEKKAWIESFVMGDYYKVSLKNDNETFVIVRAERHLKYGDNEIGHISCVNVYDHGMGWIRQPAIGSFVKTGTKYVVEHIVEGIGRVAM